MKKKKKAHKPQVPAEAPQKKPFPVKRALLTVLFTVLSVIFFMLTATNPLFGPNVGLVITVIYWAALLGFALAYIIYNRGFVRNTVTYEELPDSYTEEEKQEFFRSRDERKEKSRWMTMVLFVLAVTILLDMINLFFGDFLSDMMDSVSSAISGK